MVGAPTGATIDIVTEVSTISNRSAARDELRGDRPWWDALAPDFFARDDTFDLTRRERLLASASGAIDSGLRVLGATGVALSAIPVGFNPVRLRRALEESAVYRQAAEMRDPTLIFRRPPRSVPVERSPARGVAFRPHDGTCEDLRFESPFVPIHPCVRDEYMRHRANRTAHARYWRHEGGPRPTVMAIHGYFADAYWFNEWYFDLRRYYEMGCDVVLVTLPFHGPRSAFGSLFSGHGFFRGGLSRINEAFAQAVFDFRIFVDYLLASRGVTQVGATGISLGGYTAALLAAIEPRLSFAMPNVPVVSLPDLTMEWTPISTAVRAGMLLFGQDLHGVRWLTAGHCPLSYDPVIDRSRLMVIGAVGDRLAPPKHARLLWEHWQRPRIHWFPGSHVLHFERDAYLDSVERFFRDVGFLDDESAAPRRGAA